MHWFPLQDSVLVTHPWLQSAKYFYSTVFLFHFIGFATLSLGRISVPLTFSISPQVLWRRARWRNMSKQVNFRVTPGASVHRSLVTNTNTKYKWPEDDGDLKSVSILKTLTWIMRRDISRINSLWHSWLGLSQRYRRDTNTSTKVHSTLKSMKEFRLHQHLTNTVQNSYIFPENEILPQKPIFIPGVIGSVLNFWKLENAWTPQTVTDIIGCLAWLKKYEHLGVFDTGDLWTLTFCTSHTYSLLVCSSRILLVKNKVKIDTVCGVHRVQWVQIQVDNLDTSDNTEEDNSHTVMIVMMIINLVIMMTAMLSPPGCNQLSGTTLQSWEGMLHCRAGRLAAWLTVQHQQHPFVKPMLSFLPICLFSFFFVCLCCSLKESANRGRNSDGACLPAIPNDPQLVVEKGCQVDFQASPIPYFGMFFGECKNLQDGIYVSRALWVRPPHAFLSNVFFGFWVAMANMLKICVIIGIWELHQPKVERTDGLHACLSAKIYIVLHIALSHIWNIKAIF